MALKRRFSESVAIPTEILADITPDDALEAAREAVRAAAAQIKDATKAAARGAVAGILGAAGIAGAEALFSESAYMGWVTGEIEEISQKLQPALFEELRRQLRTAADPRALATAEAVATRQSRRIAGNMAAAEMNKIGKVISEGIAGGQHPFAVARRLDAVKGLDASRVARYEKAKGYFESLDISTATADKRLEAFRQKLLRDRRKTIAHTEMRLATSEAKIERARNEGSQFKAWSTTGDDKVSEEDCAPNEAQGWIRIKDSFISGHDATPAHPNCRCTIVFKTKAPTAADKARRETKAAQTGQAGKRGKNEKAAEKIEAKAKKKDATQKLQEVS